MAEPSTKDRDLNVPTAETSSASGPSLPNSAKARNKLLALKLNSSSGPKKQPKKATEKVSIDNIPEAELQALLDEVLQYSGKRDGEKGSELFQALLRETQESGEESPPAFRSTQNTSNSSAHKRRKSRKETCAPTSASSASTSSVAGSNRKGGSLQNISTHSQSEWGSVRRRKRHDTSDSGSALGSPRKREGGSLPCDVARGSVKTVKPDDLVLGSDHNQTERSRVNSDFVIDIDEMIESTTSFSESKEKTSERRNHNRRTENSSTSGIEPMEQDMEHSSSVHDSLTKKLLSKTPKEYGTIQSFEVDAPIPMVSFDSSNSSQEVTKSTTIMNGTSLEEGIPFHRRNQRSLGGGGESRMDENGNPFGSINGLPNPPFLLRSSPPAPITTSTMTTATTTTTNSTSVISTSKFSQRGKNKKKGENVLYSDNLPGYVGNLNVDQLLEYIESSETNGKKAADKKAGSKHNGTLTKESATKIKSRDKKSSSKLLHRQTNSNQADSEDSDTQGGSDSNPSPVGKNDDSIFRTKSEGVEEFEAVVAAAAADFQTVTKRQRRKKRNSLSNSTAGSKTKELLEQSHMNLFYNASSPSVMMRPPRQTPTTSSGNQAAIHGGGGGVQRGANEAAKKLVASVPPSEPSDLDSDGGDSVHSLPVQPSAPLFPPLHLYQPPPPSAQNSISYAAVMRAEQQNPSKTDVVFLAESSQPVDVKTTCATTPNAISNAAIGTKPIGPVTDLVAPAATTVVAANVPCNRPAPRSTSSGVPLRRAASLPPTSPSVETPPVVIVGSSSSTQVDVTFGFELNLQLLALSIQPSLQSQSQPKATQSSLLTPPESSTEPIMVSFSPEPGLDTTTGFFSSTSTPPSSSPEAVTTPPSVDFASRYRERPELLNPPFSRRSYEIVDFISQAWKRIERKLDEQQQQQHGKGSAALSLQSSIRVYTLE